MLIKQIEFYFNNKKNNNKFKALVTAGPTKEFIDPIRFISNKSSGKQGYAIAKSFRDNGFETTLISGQTNLDAISGVRFIKIDTAQEMFDETIKNLPADVAVFTAAVADYKITNYENKKIKKENLNLSLEKNIDILASISKHNSLRPKLTIGFAAETNNLVKNSLKKLEEKNCDWIVANDVSNNSIGFDSDENQISIFYKDKKNENLKKMSKSLVASELVNRVIEKLS